MQIRPNNTRVFGPQKIRQYAGLENKNKGGRLMRKDLPSIEEIMEMPRSEFADRCFIIGAPGAGSAFKARVAFLGNTGRSAKSNSQGRLLMGDGKKISVPKG